MPKLNEGAEDCPAGFEDGPKENRVLGGADDLTSEAGGAGAVSLTGSGAAWGFTNVELGLVSFTLGMNEEAKEGVVACDDGPPNDETSELLSTSLFPSETGA